MDIFKLDLTDGIVYNGSPVRLPQSMDEFLAAVDDTVREIGREHSLNRVYLLERLGIVLCVERVKNQIIGCTFPFDPARTPHNPPLPFSGELIINDCPINSNSRSRDLVFHGSVKFEPQLAGAWAAKTDEYSIHLCFFGKQKTIEYVALSYHIRIG